MSDRSTKKIHIQNMIARGLDDHEIAALVHCTPGYVNVVRNKNGTYITQRPVKMVFGPWTTDAQGNLSREIRGT